MQLIRGKIGSLWRICILKGPSSWSSESDHADIKAAHHPLLFLVTEVLFLLRCLVVKAGISSSPQRRTSSTLSIIYISDSYSFSVVNIDIILLFDSVFKAQVSLYYLPIDMS
jgi:hypothetical protein